MKKLLVGDELKKRAIELGVNTMGSVSQESIPCNADDAEIQRRVIEAERSLRESKLWIITLVSAIASVISAITAIIVVLLKR